MDTIESLNEAAVNSFCARRRAEAMSYFTHAVQIVEELINDPDQRLFAGYEPSILQDVNLDVVPIDEVNDYGEHGLCDSISFYNSFIVFHVPRSSEKAGQCAMAAAAIFYNIGVCYHWAHRDRKEQYLVTEALKRYNLAANFFQRALYFYSNISLLSLALANNLAHLHSLNYDKVGTDASLRCLERSLHTAKENIASCGDAFDYFYITLFLSHETMKHCCTASAA